MKFLKAFVLGFSMITLVFSQTCACGDTFNFSLNNGSFPYPIPNMIPTSLADDIFGQLIDLSFNWGNITDAQKSDLIKNQLGLYSLYSNSSTVKARVLRDILSQMAMSVNFDQSHGDMSMQGFQYRLPIRRNLFDLIRNAEQTPSNYALYLMKKMIHMKIDDIDSGYINPAEELINKTISDYTQMVNNLGDYNELKALRRAYDLAQKAPYPTEVSYLWNACWHGGCPESEVYVQQFGYCPHHSPSFLIWHREYVRQMEEIIQYYEPGLMLHYMDWVEMVQQGLPNYFKDAQCLSDYSNLNDTGLFQIQLAQAQKDLSNVQILVNLIITANQTKSLADVQKIIDLVTSEGLPFNKDYLKNYATNSATYIVNFINMYIIPKLNTQIQTIQGILGPAIKNPFYSSYNPITKKDTIRYGHTYQNLQQYQNSLQYRQSQQFALEQKLSFLLQTAAFEQSFNDVVFQQQTAIEQGQSLGELMQNSLGFRSLIEECHDFMHIFVGGVQPTFFPNGTSSGVLLGDMTALGISSFDPFFQFLHAYADYLFTEWQTLVEKEYGLAADYNSKQFTQCQKSRFPKYFYDEKIEPYLYWQKTVGEVVHEDYVLYERSASLPKLLAKQNNTYLKQGFVIEIANVPIHQVPMDQQKIDVYMKLKNNSGWMNINSIYQFIANTHFDPMMIQNMAQGTYARSLYIDPVFFKTQMLAKGDYVMDPVLGPQFYLVATYTSAVALTSNPIGVVVQSPSQGPQFTSYFHNAVFNQVNASLVDLAYPDGFNPNETLITQDISDSNFYYGSILMRDQEKCYYEFLIDKYSVTFFNDTETRRYFNFYQETITNNSWQLINLNGYSNITFVWLNFIRDENIGIILLTTKSATKKFLFGFVTDHPDSGNSNSGNLHLTTSTTTNSHQKAYFLSKGIGFYDQKLNAAIIKPWILFLKNEAAKQLYSFNQV